MKKVISALFVAVCLCMAIPAQAQLKLGVKGGLNLSKVSFDNTALSSDNSAGFFIGPMLEFTLPVVGLGLDAALLYSEKKVKLEDHEAEKAQGIDIPVNLKYTIGLGSMFGVYVAAGPDFYFDFSKDEDAAKGKLNRNNAQVGINLGAGVKLIKHLQIGFNYNLPLSDSGDVQWSDALDINFKTKTWQVSAAYIF